jgi:hypothetical protein
METRMDIFFSLSKLTGSFDKKVNLPGEVIQEDDDG